MSTTISNGVADPSGAESAPQPSLRSTPAAGVGGMVEGLLSIGVASDRSPMLVADASAPTRTRRPPVFAAGLSSRSRRIARYGATSVFALGISEAVLLAVYATGAVNATLAALIGNVAGIVPSYLVSRYWIWRDAPRERTGRQFALYWAISLVSMVLSSAGTGGVADLIPKSTSLHLLFVGGGFLAVSFALWVTKFVLYQRFVFSTDARCVASPSAASRRVYGEATVISADPLAEQLCWPHAEAGMQFVIPGPVPPVDG